MEQVVEFLFKYRAALFEKAQFGFGARPSAFLIAAIAACLALLVWFIYAHKSVALSPGWRVALIGLRVALIALFIFCLMRPVIVVPSVTPQSSYVAVLMDDSASMKLADENGGARLDAVKQLMSPGSLFAAALYDKFKVRAYKFANAAERIGDAGELTGGGELSDVRGALEHAARDSAGLPMSGVILLSDGASNGAEDQTGDFALTLDSLRARGMPVFAVGVGKTKLENDVELVRATAPRRVLVGSSVTAELLVRASSVSQKSVKINLAEDNRAMRSQDIPLQGDADTVARITFTPLLPGLHRYTFTAEALPGEVIPDNNTQELLIEVEDARPKILYIEGEPRWEYGKLRSAMVEEKNITLVSVMRSADGKFYRQGVESGDDLASGPPKSEEEFFKYDAIIIGSAEATFFTFDQLKAMEQFVARRGGTLLALGGSKSFSAGGYNNTPMADLLPVYLRAQNDTPGELQGFKAAPAARGKDHPAARLNDDPDANAKTWEQMPPITLPEIITETKPGATVVLEARNAQDGNRAVPLLVEQRFGRGRAMALLASDTWRWRMLLEAKNKSFETFWRNLLRYTVESVRRRVEATTERSLYGKGETVRVRAEVGDEKYLNVSDARVVARVTTPTGRTVDVAMRPYVEEGFEGYEGAFVPDEDGLHQVEVTAQRGKESASLGAAKSSFLTGPINREARNAAQNRELLKRIATETGGGYYTMGEADNLLEDITHHEGANSVRVAYDLWDMPINFLLAVALAAAEWFIRKRKGLA
ncbi:MAG TPA: glutamine amidotransferase [Blastocatellia bacterium]|nr:glutamine amidotransferase [Blastocatellia bacterium]